MPTLMILKMAAFVSQTWNTAEQMSCTRINGKYFIPKLQGKYLLNINFNSRILICRFVLFFTLCSSVALSMCLMNPVYEVVGMK